MQAHNGKQILIRYARIIYVNNIHARIYLYLFIYFLSNEMYQYIHKRKQCNLLDEMMFAALCATQLFAVEYEFIYVYIYIYIYTMQTLAIAIRILLLNPLNFSNVSPLCYPLLLPIMHPLLYSFLGKYVSLLGYYSQHCRILMLNDLAFSTCTHFKWPCSWRNL